MNSSKRLPLRYLLLAFMLMGATQLSAQIIIDAPEPANSLFCPGIGGFNQYFVDISWTGTPQSDNEFILELSDSSGSFATAVELARESGQNTIGGDFSQEFAVPTNARGDGYRLRVRSTSPVATSPESSPLAIYYQGADHEFQYQSER